MASAEFDLQSKYNDTLLLRLVELSQLLTEFSSRDTAASRMQNSKDELFAVKESVGDEFGCTEGDGAFRILQEDCSQPCLYTKSMIERWKKSAVV